MIERDPLLQTEQLVVQPGLQAGEMCKDLAGRVVFRTLSPTASLASVEHG